MLYPLKFFPIYKSKIWGGNKVKEFFGKDFSPLPNCGESWEISGVEDNISIVSNGFLKNNNLSEIIDIYMDELIGLKVFEQFGPEFPLLIKFIDANDILSIQVHPDDELAKKRHHAFGKTEMWYIIDSLNNAEIITGFNKKIDKNIYLKYFNEKKLIDILNIEKVKPGDALFIPAGRVHSIGKGIFLAEIQQTSDITYRIYDWQRKDENGNEREMHTDLAVDAIDYEFYENYKTKYNPVINSTAKIIDCKYFTTNIILFDDEIYKDYFEIDSFVIFICISGNFRLYYDHDNFENVKAGETILLPAEIKNVKLVPFDKVKLLEIYIK